MDHVNEHETGNKKLRNLRNLGRIAAGYGLASLGFVLTGIGGGAGLAAGAGLMYGSREVLRPIFQTDESQRPKNESVLKKLGRGLLFGGGMLLQFTGVGLASKALFSDAGELNLIGRAAYGLLGAAGIIGGGMAVNTSYKPELYGEADGSENAGNQIENGPSPATA